MGQTPTIAPLKETDLLIPDGDVKGEQIRQVFRRLFGQLNPFFDTVTKLATNITLQANERCDLLTGTFSHGVPTALRLQRTKVARSAIVRSCSGAIPIGSANVRMQAQQYTGAPATALVTLFFTNPSAQGVTAMVELREEGLAAPALPPVDGVRAQYQTTAAQSVVSAVDQVVNFETVVVDTDKAVSVGSGWNFTVPAGKGGMYLFSAGVTLVLGAAAVNNLRLRVRNRGAPQAMLQSVQVPAASGAFAGVSGAAALPVLPGDVIDFTLYQDSGGSLSTATDAQLRRGSWCSIVRLLGY